MLRVVEKVVKRSDHKFEYVDLGGGMGINYDNNNNKLDLKNIQKN